MYDYISSNARKLDYTQTEYRRDVNKLRAEKENKEKISENRKNSGVKQSQAVATVRKMFLVAVGFMLAFFVVRGYVAINEADNRINELSHDLRMVQAENQAIKAKIDKSVDLKNLQAIANEKFGMVRPENYQVFYVNLDSGDYSENVEENNSESNTESVAVEGAAGVLISSADMFK